MFFLGNYKKNQFIYFFITITLEACFVMYAIDQFHDAQENRAMHAEIAR